MTGKLDILGLITHWGMTPAITPFYEEQFKKDEQLNILLAECGDIRHILKMTSEYLTSSTQRSKPINVYILERSKQNIARDLLFLSIICQTELSIRERMELFLDLYGNTMIRQKSALYLDQIYKELINLIYEEHKKCKSPLIPLCVFKNLKSREKDDIQEILRSWDSRIPFNLGQARDRRVRADLESKYDFKVNAFDWDYQMYLKAKTDIVHFYHYKMFRNTGVSFETRLAQNVGPNRTLSSYAPGRTKKQRDSCLVRGFWGDIWNSPYLSFGVEVWKEPEKENFFKQINFQHPYNSVDITQWHVQYYISMLEKQEEFSHPFKQISKASGEEEQKEKGGATVEQVKQEDDEDEGYQKADKQATFQESTQVSQEEKKAQEKQQQEEGRNLLNGFKKSNIRLHFLTDSFEKLVNKKKYAKLFNVIVFSIMAQNQLQKQFDEILKPKARLIFETVEYLSRLKPDQKKVYKQHLTEKATKRGWKVDPKWRFDHHLAFLS